MRADVAVIGGGVIGLACADALARRGAGVTVLEAFDGIGQGSSARAAGGIRAQFGTAPNIAFSRYSIDAYERMRAAGAPIAFHQTGYLLLAGTDQGERLLRSSAELQRTLGVPTELLAPSEVLEHAPFVRTDGLRLGAFHGRDGFLDPAGAVAGFERAARAAGVALRFRARVTAAAREDDGWTLILGDGEPVRCGEVVNAAGPDARAAGAVFGTDLPVEPVRRNLALVLDPTPGALTPMTVDLDTGVLVRREVAGGWLVAYANPEDPPGRETSVDPRFLEDLAERIGHRFPFLETLPIDPARCWAGLYPETPDHHAIVGLDPAIPGLVHAVGFGGHGVMHAPAAGQAVAELVTDGRSETFDLEPLRPSRFAEGALVVEPNVF